MVCSSKFILHNKPAHFASLSPKERWQVEELRFQAYRASRLFLQIDVLRSPAGSPWFPRTRPPSSAIPRR